MQGADDFFEVLLIGITTGCVYALVALGYTLVYGILELINFAHGDVFMLGGMFTITVATGLFSLHQGQGCRDRPDRARDVAHLDDLLRRDQRDDRVHRLPAVAGAPRLAPLITAIGVSFILEDIGARVEGPELPHRSRCLPALGVFTLGGVDYEWNKRIVVRDHRAGAARR